MEDEQLNELYLFMGGIFSTKLFKSDRCTRCLRADSLIGDKSLGPGNDHP